MCSLTVENKVMYIICLYLCISFGQKFKSEPIRTQRIYTGILYIKVHGDGSHGNNLKIENGHVDNETLHLGQSLNMHI